MRPFIYLASVSACVLTACSSDDGFKSKVFDSPATIAAQNLAPNEKAERLARTAEALLSTQGFAYANEIAGIALSIDSNNLRAKFVKSLTTVVVAQRGLYAGLKPAANVALFTKHRYEVQLSKLQTNVSKSISEFLLEDVSNLNTEADIQAHVDKTIEALDELRRFAKENKAKELTIRTTDTLIDEMVRRFSTGCTWQTAPEGEVVVKCPPSTTLHEVTLNRADFEAIQGYAAGYMLYYGLQNSYDLTGAFKQVSRRDAAELSREQIVTGILEDEKFGRLRQNNAFRLVSALGADAVVAARWILDNQKTLCASGSSSDANRPGFAFDRGICVEPHDASKMEDALSKTQIALAGDAFAASFPETMDPAFVTQIKPMALIKAPPENIRRLTPLKWNKCDRIIESADSTGNGVFLAGDLNRVLKAAQPCYE